MNTLLTIFTMTDNAKRMLLLSLFWFASIELVGWLRHWP